VVAEPTLGGADVDVEQPVHGHDAAAGPYCGGDQSAARQERPDHDTTLRSGSGPAPSD
jgi:hypothetical protein